MKKNLVIIIAGPTASGKSGLALDVAVALNGVVLNADSMQVYKEAPILSACPDEADMQRVPHKMYRIFEAQTKGSVVDWLNFLVSEIKLAWNNNMVPVVVGGTGLYIDNLICGTTPISETPDDIRQKVADLIEDKGLEFVYGLLDDDVKKTVKPKDSTRIKRAYEVFLHTGESIAKWHKKPKIKKLPEANFLVVKLLPTAEQTDPICAKRFDEMINAGAINEVENLLNLNLPPNLPASKILGFPELAKFVKGQSSLEDAVKMAVLHTRQYAKRQRTWFANKLKANIEFAEPYKGQKNLLKSIIELAQK